MSAGTSGFDFGPEVIDDPSQLIQTIFEESATQKHAIGAKFIGERRGKTKVFRYVKVGASNISKAQLQQGPAPTADHTNIALTASSAAVGDIDVVIATALSTAAVADEYKNGVFHINDAGAEGSAYDVKGNTVGTTPTITLYDPIVEALVATSEWTLTRNPHNGIIVTPTTLTSKIVGIPAIDLTAGYYGWIQTAGPAPCLVDTAETLVIGEAVGYPAAIAVAGACGVAAVTDHIVGQVLSVNAASEYALINLTGIEV